MVVTITAAQAGRSVKSVLKGELGVSTTLLNRLKRREGALLCNGRPVYTNAILAEGDVLTVDLRDAPSNSSLPPIPMALDILYEDEALLVINKSAPLAVHPSSFVPEEPTLANGLAHHLGPSFVFHPVNRLDRGTTGLMVVAKSQYIHNLLREQLHSERFYREYRGIAVGSLTPPAGRIDLPIARAEDSPIKRCIRSGGCSAQTDYETLCRRKGLSLLRLIPRTGRTHQLRLHLSAVGHPLLGDWLYGEENRSGIGRPALHAYYLRLQHPLTGRLCQWAASLPADMIPYFPDFIEAAPAAGKEVFP